MKKNQSEKKKKKGSQDPAFYNDQIGENAGEGRLMERFRNKSEKNK